MGDLSLMRRSLVLGAFLRGIHVFAGFARRTLRTYVLHVMQYICM
jgi:hypothetical protein